MEQEPDAIGREILPIPNVPSKATKMSVDARNLAFPAIEPLRL